jgi:hypothetical protein
VADQHPWTKAAWDSSVSSRCWDYTPYSEGWDKCAALREDEELRQIVLMERAIGSIPDWAQQVVSKSINFVPPCGHYLFPRPQWEVVDAIVSGRVPPLIHSCFVVERARKRELMDCCLCLDAWLGGACADDPVAELVALGWRKIDWASACKGLWQTLGAHTELKDLLAERLLLLLRWWVKFTVWDDDLATTFGRDQYLGRYTPTGSPSSYSNRDRQFPNFKLRELPRFQAIDKRVAELTPHAKWFRNWMNEWWLCAPKAMRFLERMLWAIGNEQPFDKDQSIPDFLRAADTWPSQPETADWYGQFITALEAWWHGGPLAGEVSQELCARLGEPTPVKRWLVRLYARKLRRIQENGEQFASLVRPR